MVAELARDGSVQVSETMTARFQGSWNGIRRQIPMNANRPGGVEPLGLKLLAVTNAKGQPYRTETRNIGNQQELRIFVPDAKNATRTAVLRYTVRNGVRFYPDHDEFNWNVTGNAWEIPIERVSARVLLPEGVRGLHASVYTGPRGTRGQDARLRIGAREVTAESTRRLEPGEGLTLAVGFDKGLVAERSLLDRAWGWLRGRLALLLPLSATLILAPIWWLVGRDPALGSVPVVYEPPGNQSPAVLGSLVQQNVGHAALGATLVDLAVKGHLRIQELREQGLFLPTHRHDLLTLLTTQKQWQALAPHEAYLIQSLFTSRQVGARVDTDDLPDRLADVVQVFQALVRDELIVQGYYRRWPGAVRSLTAFGGINALFVVLWLAAQLLPRDLAELQMVVDPQLLGFSLLATVGVICVFAWFMPSRTLRGVEVLRQTLGYQEFLRRVDAPRFERVILTPELFERFLPYAMAAGLTKRWVAAFKDIVQTPPSWYIGIDENFNLEEFGDCLEHYAQISRSAVESSLSGSSSSGSSGGGSSGGGDGGGGGGGF